MTNEDKLPCDFYARDTHVVARELLGKLLVRKWRGKELVGRICEVESYVGEGDKACHASKGLTPRTRIMFGAAGHAYVYMIYGMYHCLNVVTESKGFPAAVLIRGVQPVVNIAGALDGPGKLCREMKVTKALNGEDLAQSQRLRIVDDGYAIRPEDIRAMEQVGVDYAGEDAKLPWRYVINLD